MNRSHQPDLAPELRRWLDLLDNHLNLEELRELCLRLGVDYDNLGGEGKRARARELLLVLERRKRIDALVDDLDRRRPDVDWRGGPRPEAVCPYKGLHAFGEEDAANFFGRELFTEQLEAAVTGRSLVAVVGPSGSGKSSVVFAGLLPRLRRGGDWLVAHFRPGSDPFLALAQGLLPLLEPDVDRIDRPARTRKLAGRLQGKEATLGDYLALIQEDHPGRQLVLIADQFEELYTQVDDETRRAFLDTLLAEGFGTASHPFATLALTLRADFMGQALAYPPMVAALQNNDLKIGLMSPEDLTTAIQQPAYNQGVRFEEGLVARILGDVGDHAGNLPLLEFALTLLWDRQSGGVMTHQAYESLNGVSGALAQYADETLERLTHNDPALEQAIQRVMVQLVHPGAGAEDTRRIARRSELGDEGWMLVPRLADARLLVTGRQEDGPVVATPESEETVEVIHEALIQNWGRLKKWMARDREFRMWQERLRDDLRLWRAHGQAKGYLLKGSPLTVAGDWLAQRREDLTGHEIAFIELSVRQRRRDNYVRFAVGAAVVGLLVIASLFVAATQRRAATDTSQALATAVAAAATADYSEQRAVQSAAEAEEAREAAETNENLANARWLVSQAKALADEEPLLALSIALEGIEALSVINDSAKTQEIVDAAREVFQWGRQAALGLSVWSLFAFEEGRYLVVVTQEGSAMWWDMEENKILRPWDKADISGITFREDRFFITEYRDETGATGYNIYDLRSDQSIDIQVDGRIRSATLHDDGQTLILDIEKNFEWAAVEFFNTVTGQQTYFEAEYRIVEVQFVDEGRLALVISEDINGVEKYNVLDTQSGQIPVFALLEDIGFLEFYGDDQYATVAYRNASDGWTGVQLYDLTQDRPLRLEIAGQVRDFELYTNQNLLAVLAEDENGSLLDWQFFDIYTGLPPEIESGGRISGLPYDVVGELYAVVDYYDQNRVRRGSTVADLNRRRPLEYVLQEDRITDLEFPLRERFMIIEREDSTGNSYSDLYDLEAGQRVELATNGLIGDLDYTADGRFIIVGYQDPAGNETDELYDLQAEEHLDYLPTGTIRRAVLHAKEQFLEVVYSGESGPTWSELYVFGTSTRPSFIEAGRLSEVSNDVYGRFLAVSYETGPSAGYSALYYLQNGEPPAFLADYPMTNVEFDTSGRHLAVTYAGGIAAEWSELYDLQTGERAPFLDEASLARAGFVSPELILVDYLHENGSWSYSKLYETGTGQSIDYLASGRMELFDVLDGGNVVGLQYVDGNGQPLDLVYVHLDFGMLPEMNEGGKLDRVDYYAEGQFLVLQEVDDSGQWLDSHIVDLQAGIIVDHQAQGWVWDVHLELDGRLMLVDYELQSSGHVYSYVDVFDFRKDEWYDSRAGRRIGWVGFADDMRLMIIEYRDNFDAPVGEEIVDVQTWQRPAGLAPDPILNIDIYPEAGLWLVEYQNGLEIFYDSATHSELKRGQNVRLVEWLVDDRLALIRADGDFEIWRTTLTGTVQLALLGGNVGQTSYISPTNQLAVRYLDGAAFLLNLDWLEAMNGRAGMLPADELIDTACMYPLKNGLPPLLQDRLTAIMAQIQRLPILPGCDAFN
jgi:hypothetical protein